MSYELTAILVVGVVMGLAQAVAIMTAISGLGTLAREMDRTRGEVNRGFEAMDRRFEETRGEVSRAFEAMDRRFEATRGEVSRAFEAMDRRFEEISRLNRAVAGLVVQESEKIQTLLRT
ncbi:MAG TPA: hypothetical protein VFE56_13705 [Candidatus Binataceae bacterium]|jgi:methyl-accepting chemotaxis protein|nr:hypothetical protein [Candidatus Binataceae bacterium]